MKRRLLAFGTLIFLLGGLFAWQSHSLTARGCVVAQPVNGTLSASCQIFPVR